MEGLEINVKNYAMKGSSERHIAVQKGTEKNRCLSCGTSINMGKRRYCSINCRQKLRHQLNMRTGLLKALNTRYAAFYFTETTLVLDILPYDSDEIFSFMYPRSPDKKPAADFSSMADKLGNAWWAEKRRTSRRYLASRCVLEKAFKNGISYESLRPLEIKKPAVNGKSLVYLRLCKSELESSELHSKIKSAYRKQAKQHHPDQGGDAAFFRKIHEAYEEIIHWAKNPTFVNRRGFPDKWFYDSRKNKWTQPTPVQMKPQV
jgi:hypothetical protein